jgi:hypothetical protein
MPNNRISDQEKHLLSVGEKIIRRNMEKLDTFDYFLDEDKRNSEFFKTLESILNGPENQLPKEPWLTAWKLINEYPQKNESSDFHLSDYILENRRQKDGFDRSLIEDIIKRVEPRVEISSPRQYYDLLFKEKSKKTKRKISLTLNNIISISFTSGDLINLSIFKIDETKDINFLIELADALKLAIDGGLNLTQRIGLNKTRNSWRLGEVKRVYYVNRRNINPNTTRILATVQDDDPDEFSRGFAPSVKLLFEVVARLASLEKDKRAFDTARYIVTRWSIEDASIYKRLWAAMAARNIRLVSVDQVADFLLRIDAKVFW